MKYRTLRTLTLLTLAGAAASLTGCAAMDKLEEAQLEGDRQACARYGYYPNTDAFADCMMRIARDRQRSANAIMNNDKKADDRRPDPSRTDCKTTEVVNTSPDGTSTTTNSRTTCVGR